MVVEGMGQVKISGNKWKRSFSVLVHGSAQGWGLITMWTKVERGHFSSSAKEKVRSGCGREWNGVI